MLSTNDITARDEDRDHIARLTADFIKAGNSITCLKSGYDRTALVVDTASQLSAKKHNRKQEARFSLMYNGKKMTPKEIAKETGVHWDTLRSRMKRGFTLEQAAAMPGRYINDA